LRANARMRDGVSGEFHKNVIATIAIFSGASPN
jgi:hypothetical protein